MAGGKALRIGIALGDKVVVAVLRGRKGAPAARCDVDLSTTGPGLTTEVARAFKQLEAELEAQGVGSTEGARVEISLLPPLSDARVLPFPPMRRFEVEAVLTRDVARYFFGSNHPRVVGVRLPDRGRSGSTENTSGSVPVLASVAPLELLDAVTTAVGQMGWRCLSFSSAHGGWLATAAALKGSPVDAVLAEVEGTIHVIRLEGGVPSSVRQIPTTDPGALGEALGPSPGRALILASPRVSDSMAGFLSKGGWSTLRDPDGWASAEEVAAARAGFGGLTLMPPSLLAERFGRRRRGAFLMVAAAAVLLLVSAGVHLWGAHRELDAIQGERAAIRDQVTPLIQARDALGALEVRIQAVESLAENAPVWTRSLVELTEALPQGTYLTSFFASGDTLELEAAAVRAGEAIEILREAGLFEDIRLRGIVEREMDEGARIQERFSLRARLPRPGGGGGR